MALSERAKKKTVERNSTEQMSKNIWKQSTHMRIKPKGIIFQKAKLNLRVVLKLPFKKASV